MVPLVDHVPAAGLRWLVQGNLRALSSSPAVMAALAPLIPKQRLDDYARETGLDLRGVEQGIVAGFPLGTLYLASVEQPLGPVVEIFAERLVAGAEVEQPHPSLLRVTGVVGTTPEAMLTHRGRWVAVASGNPRLIRVVEAYALGKLRRSPPAFHGAALRSFQERKLTSLVSFFAPGPLEGIVEGDSGLLSQATAVGVGAGLGQGGTLDVTIALDGAWDPQRALDDQDALLLLWQKVSQSPTGRLFGLHEPSAPARVSATPGRLELSVGLNLAPLIGGIHDAVSADAREIFDLR